MKASSKNGRVIADYLPERAEIAERALWLANYADRLANQKRPNAMTDYLRAAAMAEGLKHLETELLVLSIAISIAFQPEEPRPARN